MNTPRLAETLNIAELCVPGTTFKHKGYLYQTIGEHLSSGGMGNVYGLKRCPIEREGDSELIAGKVFHSEYLYRLSTDEVARSDYHYAILATEQIASHHHPNLLPIYLSTPIRDNHLFLSPRKHTTLLAAVSQNRLGAKTRVSLLIQALRGLEALHHLGLIHRDFTLRNILVDATFRHAFLFDFDLTLQLHSVAKRTYRDHYQGRIFGSPGYSVPPEVLAPTLLDSAITTKLDIYAVGGAIFGLFTDQLPSGPSQDMWSLLARISEGIVHSGKSSICYPKVVPKILHPIIDACLEHNPNDRAGQRNFYHRRARFVY